MVARPIMSDRPRCLTRRLQSYRSQLLLGSHPAMGAESYTAGTAKAVPVLNLARLTMLRAVPLVGG